MPAGPLVGLSCSVCLVILSTLLSAHVVLRGMCVPLDPSPPTGSSRRRLVLSSSASRKSVITIVSPVALVWSRSRLEFPCTRVPRRCLRIAPLGEAHSSVPPRALSNSIDALLMPPRAASADGTICAGGTGTSGADVLLLVFPGRPLPPPELPPPDADLARCALALLPFLPVRDRPTLRSRRPPPTPAPSVNVFVAPPFVDALPSPPPPLP